MDLAALIGELDKHGMNIEDCHLVNGELTVSHLAISRHPFGANWPDGKWCVYFRSSAELFDFRLFDNESAACEKFLARILRAIHLRRKYGRMTINGLKHELGQYNIDPAWYSVDGRFAGDELVLSKDFDGRWAVFKAERGARQNEVDFSSESEACIHFFDRIVSYAEVLNPSQSR